LTPGNLPGGQTWYFDPPQIFWNDIFSGTHPHGIYIIIILYSETRSKTVFLLSFITDLWTPRNVALVTLTPQVKNSSRAPVNEHDDDDDDNVRRLIGTG